MDLKSLEIDINNFKMDEVTFESVLEYKKLSNKILIIEKKFLWDNFNEQIILLDLHTYNVFLDTDIIDKNDYPKNIVLLIREKVNSMIKIENDSEQKNKLNKLKISLSNLYIKCEDIQDDIQNDTYYLYDLIDKKFAWLDDDEEFIAIAEILEQISKEICDKIQSHIDEKRKFYVEYIETTYKLNTNHDITDYSKIYVTSYIKNYILKNFGGMFDQVCLDVLESNGINEEKWIKTIISLYYDYTKQIIKLFLALNDIDIRTNMCEKAFEI